MRLTAPLLLLLCALPLTAPAWAGGTVKTSFEAPEKFSDIGFGSVERERALSSLSDFLASLGPAMLSDGQTLELTVTDIDLAGEPRFAPHGDARVLRGGADWPQIKLRYTLKAGDTVLRSGADTLSDINYLAGRRTLELNTEYGHEKRMLKDWVGKTFAAPR